MVVTARSNSGLEIGRLLERGICFREKIGVTRGSFFANTKGKMIRSNDLEMDILDRIARIQQRHPELIQPRLEVHKEYRISISFRRGSKSEAQNREVEDDDIDHNNRWRKVKRAGTRKAKIRMSDHYTDMLVSRESF